MQAARFREGAVTPGAIHGNSQQLRSEFAKLGKDLVVQGHLVAAHAGCFTMALSLILGEAKLTAERMETSARVTLEKLDGGYAITAVHLAINAKIPGADQATFEKLAGMAKAGCPVSKLLKAEITLDATLVS